MSFSSDIKKEISRAETGSRCCIKAELCAFICFGAAVTKTEDGFSIRISTENASAAKRCFTLIKKAFNPKIELEIQKSRAGRGSYAYVLNIDDDLLCRTILKDTGLWDKDFDEHITFRISDEISGKECCAKSFIRGAFLAGGSSATPEKGYHTEFVTHHHNLSKDFSAHLRNMGIEPKIIKRKSNYVLYYKGGDENEDLLGIMGAVNCMMEFANVRIMKETRNNVNRKVNCETANMDKALQAAWQQLEAIKKIRMSGEFEKLSPPLKQIVLLREENPEAPLSEIAKKTNPPISKSGTSHRLAKLCEIANNLR